jgi:hypothetical protein
MISALRASWSSLELKQVGPIDLLRFSSIPANLSSGLASFLYSTSSHFWLMRHRAAMTCRRYSLQLPREKMVTLKMVPYECLTFRLSDDFFLVTRSVGGTFRMGGQLLSCPFSHSEFFKPFRALEDGNHFGVLPECHS